MDPFIESAQIRQAELDIYKRAYFAKGGKVQDLGLCERVPHGLHVAKFEVDASLVKRRAESAKKKALFALVAENAERTGPSLTASEVRIQLVTKGHKASIAEVALALSRAQAKHGAVAQSA